MCPRAILQFFYEESLVNRFGVGKRHTACLLPLNDAYNTCPVLFCNAVNSVCICKGNDMLSSFLCLLSTCLISFHSLRCLHRPFSFFFFYPPFFSFTSAGVICARLYFVILTHQHSCADKHKKHHKAKQEEKELLTIEFSRLGFSIAT